MPLSKGLNFKTGLTATINTTTKQIDLSQDVPAVAAATIAAFPTASESTAGKVELADTAEANALSVTNRAVSPGRLPIASATQQGLVELATAGEANGLSDTVRAITPATLPIASPTQQGLIELATAAEVLALTDTTRAVTPGTLPGASTTQRGLGEVATQAEMETPVGSPFVVSPANQIFHPSAAKAFVVFDVAGATQDDLNWGVSSVTDNGTGDWTVNFSLTGTSSFGFCVVPGLRSSGAHNANVLTPTANSSRITARDSAGTLADPAGTNPRVYAVSFARTTT